MLKITSSVVKSGNWMQAAEEEKKKQPNGGNVWHIKKRP